MKNDLASIPLFSNLTPEQLELLAAKIRNLTYPKASIIISEGEISESLFILRKGKIRIYISDNDGREMLLNELGPGDYFGDLSIIDREPHSASAVTLCNCEVSVISSADFLQLLQDSSSFAINILKETTKRLRKSTVSQRQLALLGVYGRLREKILSLCKEVNGVVLLDPKPTQQEFANMIGASRETVSRILKDLVGGGYIEKRKKSLLINKALPLEWKRSS